VLKCPHDEGELLALDMSGGIEAINIALAYGFSKSLRMYSWYRRWHIPSSNMPGLGLNIRLGLNIKSIEKRPTLYSNLAGGFHHMCLGPSTQM